MLASDQIKYCALESKTNSALDENDRDLLKEPLSRKLLLHAFWIVICFTVFVFGVFLGSYLTVFPHNRSEDHVMTWLNGVPTQFNQTVQFNGSLEATSQYRGRPSEQVDAAWNWTTHVGPVDLGLDRNDIQKLGVDPDTVVRYPNGVYMVELEFSHQLHCLDLLRMATHFDYYQSQRIEFRQGHELMRTHLDHCIEMLRQAIMCHADVNLFPSQWVKEHPKPYPNFNVVHQCRDFDSVLQYGLDRRVRENGIFPSKPEGVKELLAVP